MLFRIHQWYARQTALVQLLLLYALNVVFWFVAWGAYLRYFNEGEKTFVYRLVHALWMALIITIPLNLKKVKQVFKKLP